MCPAVSRRSQARRSASQPQNPLLIVPYDRIACVSPISGDLLWNLVIHKGATHSVVSDLLCHTLKVRTTKVKKAGSDPNRQITPPGSFNIPRLRPLRSLPARDVVCRARGMRVPVRCVRDIHRPSGVPRRDCRHSAQSPPPRGVRGFRLLCLHMLACAMFVARDRERLRPVPRRSGSSTHDHIRLPETIALCLQKC